MPVGTPDEAKPEGSDSTGQIVQHVEGMGHHPAIFRIGLSAVDGEVLIPRIMIGLHAGHIVGGADEDVVGGEHRPQGLVHLVGAGPGPVHIIQRGVAVDGGGHFQGVVGHEMGAGLLVPCRLPPEMHHVVPVQAVAVGLRRPAEVDLLDDGAEVAELVDGQQRVAADIGIEIDVAEVEGPGDLHALDAGGLCRQLHAGAQGVVVERMGPGCDGLHQGGIGEAAGHGAAMVEAVEVGGRAIGVAAMGRLEADDATTACRDADGAADVGAGGECGEACGKCCTRTAGRAAGTPCRRPGIARHTPDARVGGAGEAELRRGGAGKDDGARLFQALDHGIGMIVRGGVHEDERAMGGAPAVHALGILHGERHTFQWTQAAAAFGVAGIRRAGHRHGLIPVLVGEAVDGGLIFAARFFKAASNSEGLRPCLRNRMRASLAVR
jgi:hypothetical protein